MAAVTDAVVPRAPSLLAKTGTAIRRNPTIFFGGTILLILIILAAIAPWITGDPLKLTPSQRLRPPSERWWFGTDQYGRDVFARTIHGARVSLVVGLSVAAFASVIGLTLGLLCGYFRKVDAIVMRVMDGIMSIPSILLAIALITLTRPGLGIVLVAIVIPKVPRVVRLTRSVVLSIR
ncbi:MAG: ABC transporter permease, partial [Alphaproteobacteria bacterium]|nr:ABC transporter permease [Alphaproteobacteria bacterium]